MEITEQQAEELQAKLRELAAHPQVRGRIVDLGGIDGLDALYRAWDRDPSSFEKANRILFATKGIHAHLRSLLEAFTSVDFLLLVGDDRIVPMARIRDRTVLFLEENYTSDDAADVDASLTTEGTTVGRALAANRYLSDDPLAVRGEIDPTDLEQRGELFLPDLAVGRLVETPDEILTAVTTFFRQDGILDMTAPEVSTAHQVLVSSYDFLIDSGKRIRERWKNAFGLPRPHDDDSLAPIDGKLSSIDWGEETATDRRFAFHEHLSGNGGEPYGILNPNGHATHYELGVPGIDRLDIRGLPALEIYGEDACGGVSQLGPIEMAGSVVYAVGCHGGLPVPGSCADDSEHSLDLPQTMLAKGVMAYIANTGYGWGLLQGVGLSERLVEIFTEELARGGTLEIGQAVRRSKELYFLESPRFDDYDTKTTMQWTLFGFPMYQIDTGIAEEKSTAPSTDGYRLFEGSPPRAEELDAVRRIGPATVVQKITGGRWAAGELDPSLPDFLIRLERGFDFRALGVHTKWTADGVPVAEDVAGCPSPQGCYYTFNSQSTGTADLPIEPLFLYDSRLSGTSQHGVLWKGGTYTDEENWTPLVAELTSNGGDASNHGSTPRRIYIRPRGPRQRGRLGNGPGACPATDREINSVVFTTGEAVKVDGGSGWRHALHQRVDLEVLYFNNAFEPAANCDRRGPILGQGPYHEVHGSTLRWSVPAGDEAGVWRVLAVYTEGTSDAEGNGRWIPLELADDGSETWRGSLQAMGSSQITYFLQAVDRRGNVSWLEYGAAPSQQPASGVELGIPRPVEVNLTPGTADLAVTLTGDRDPVGAGEPLLYTIRVDNLGPEPASRLAVTGTLSGGVILAGGPGWACDVEREENREIHCTRDLLDTAASSEISVLVLAPVRETTLIAEVSVTALAADPASDNNTDSETTQVVP